MNNQVFKALADPTRREILRLLAKGEMNAGELADRFDMTKPTVSHHFAVLKEADLIVSRREGQQIIYSLNTTVAQDVLAWLWDLLGSPTGNVAERTISPGAIAAPATTTIRKTS
ncbi:MAG TPA: autorepressor SdpR family transcription factor [Pirellulaceae bacterium]|jgi:DNA-binding transcriptional ArsR family regulator